MFASSVFFGGLGALAYYFGAPEFCGALVVFWAITIPFSMSGPAKDEDLTTKIVQPPPLRKHSTPDFSKIYTGVIMSNNKINVDEKKPKDLLQTLDEVARMADEEMTRLRNR